MPLQQAPRDHYVLAVSGGVDSVVLLHMMAAEPDTALTVAHFDHGIRPDSDEDRKLVQHLARHYKLPFIYEHGNLGAQASEAQARAARYKFLHRVRHASGAQAIMTAHHEDDLLETAVLNMVRGTGRRGLSSLKSTDTVVRPLLNVSKQQLRAFAERHQLVWREDSTNQDDAYLRNYVRLHIMPKLSAGDRQKLLYFIRKAAQHNASLTHELSNYLHVQPGTHELNRHDFILLPHTVAREVLAEWLLLRGQIQLSRKLLERLVIAAKTARNSARVDVDGRYWLEISRDALALRMRER